jgi:hypothetical protein
MHYLSWFAFFGFLLTGWFGVQHVGTSNPLTTRGIVALAVFVVAVVLYLLLVIHGGA